MRIDEHVARLAKLAKEIYRLEAELMECKREALNPTGSEADYVGAIDREAKAKAALDRALLEHFISSHFVLTTQQQQRSAA